MEERILIVDDEKEIADLLEIYCVNENYTVYKFYSPVEALSCLQREPIDLAVIDVMMPEMSGFTLCRRIREQYYFPVIMLTAKVEDADKIAGLTMGADDYVTKPFHPPELMARIKTQLRRYKKYNAQTPMKQEIEYDFRGLCVNRQKHRCELYGEEVLLTPIEFEILWYLCRRRGQVVSSEELFEAVWKEKYYDNNNTVMAHIARLREKLKEPPRKPKFIKTVWGVGYTIEAEE